MTDELHKTELGKERIGKKALYRATDWNKREIKIDVVAVDHQVRYGHNEYKVQPVCDGVELEAGWVRKLDWYRSDEEISYES